MYQIVKWNCQLKLFIFKIQLEDKWRGNIVLKQAKYVNSGWYKIWNILYTCTYKSGILQAEFYGGKCNSNNFKNIWIQ